MDERRRGVFGIGLTKSTNGGVEEVILPRAPTFARDAAEVTSSKKNTSRLSQKGVPESVSKFDPAIQRQFFQRLEEDSDRGEAETEAHFRPTEQLPDWLLELGDALDWDSIHCPSVEEPGLVAEEAPPLAEEHGFGELPPTSWSQTPATVEPSVSRVLGGQGDPTTVVDGCCYCVYPIYACMLHREDGFFHPPALQTHHHGGFTEISSNQEASRRPAKIRKKAEAWTEEENK